MRSLKLAALLGVGVVLIALASRADALVHLRLVKAEPAADSTVTEAPTEIRLFFSQDPVLPATSIRMLDADETAIELGEPVVDGEDTKVIKAAVSGAVPPGTYSVNWRTTSSDGHVIRGDFRFTYRAPAAGRDSR